MWKKAEIFLPKGKDAKNVSYNIVDGKIEVYYDVEDKRYESGNYFRTPEAARKVADQIKDIFKNSKPE